MSEFVYGIGDWQYWVSLAALVFVLFVAIPWIGKRFT
jgi:hypothetical protein